MCRDSIHLTLSPLVAELRINHGPARKRGPGRAFFASFVPNLVAPWLRLADLRTPRAVVTRAGGLAQARRGLPCLKSLRQFFQVPGRDAELGEVGAPACNDVAHFVQDLACLGRGQAEGGGCAQEVAGGGLGAGGAAA